MNEKENETKISAVLPELDEIMDTERSWIIECIIPRKKTGLRSNIKFHLVSLQRFEHWVDMVEKGEISALKSELLYYAQGLEVQE
jgi:hypothetical protein